MRGIAERQNSRRRCVVIFASEDDLLAKKLAGSLSVIGFDGWSSHQITHGRWNVAVEQELATCDAVVPLVTRHTRRKDIFQDEWRLAEKNSKPIFPFAVDPDGIPLGFGQYSRTDAPDWDGSPEHPSIHALHGRLQRHFGTMGTERLPLAGEEARRILEVGKKQLELPAFVFSLSTFETQLDPHDGLELVSSLAPAACLVSAYDFYKYLKRQPLSLRRSMSALEASRTVLFLDSGNYEATRKNDHRTPENDDGWSPEKFWEVASGLPADIVFTYDPPARRAAKTSVTDVVKRYIRDLKKSGLDARTLCPIVHVPDGHGKLPDSGVSLVFETAKELHPTMVAIPERELGDGLGARMHAVKALRRKLDELGYYQPLHILGTGNPISIAALAACGADSFDGLEWCRTAANYETNSLMHFQQFDFLLSAFRGRIKNPAARALAELNTAPFALRVASYNCDYFEEWARTIQKLTRSGDSELLMKIIPTLGTALVESLKAEVSA